MVKSHHGLSTWAERHLFQVPPDRCILAIVGGLFFDLFGVQRQEDSKSNEEALVQLG